MADEKLSLDDVRKVAKLARLALGEEQIAKLGGELVSILQYVEKMNEVDTANVEPVAHALPLSNVLREDVVSQPLTVDQVLQNAPERDGDFFKVPKIIGGDEDSAG